MVSIFSPEHTKDRQGKDEGERSLTESERMNISRKSLFGQLVDVFNLKLPDGQWSEEADAKNNLSDRIDLGMDNPKDR